MSKLDRRSFLKISVSAGAGIVIGIYIPGCKGKPAPEPTMSSTSVLKPTDTLPPSPTSQPATEATQAPEATSAIPEDTAPTASAGLPQIEQLEPNVYVTIDSEGSVTITVPRSEMGQGVRTALPMILAEELEADWSTIRVEQAPGDRKFGDQTTGGSTSVRTRYQPLRRAGAVAREMLIAAAAQTWGVDPNTCRAQMSTVVHPPSGRQLSYGELVPLATTLPIPAESDVTIKAADDFQLIGTSVKRVDGPDIVTGKAVYGIDVAIPDMLVAVLARCPVFRGSVASFDGAPAKAVEGVRDVLQIGGSVAVVADHTWAALQGREALQVTWDEGSNAGLDSAGIRGQVASILPEPVGVEQTDEATSLAMAYDIPFLAHATMEPMNCVADVRADECEVWAPTQDPQQAKQRAQAITGLPAESIIVHVPLIGGGFGRRLQTDYVDEAVAISKAVGAPVKVMWTREDDMRHDFYHPLSITHVTGKLDKTGAFFVQPRLQSVPARSGVPTGAWRSVGNFTEAFAHESFLDEAAAATGKDPLELRLADLPQRAQQVVRLAAEKAGWGTPLPDGWGRGLAYHATFGVTHVAQVAEVSVTNDGAVAVHRVVCAVDAGVVINPDLVIAQMEGGIVFGLTAALKASITIADGRSQESNFHDYPLLRMSDMPEVEVVIVPSTEAPTGIGEMGVPPIAPAVANAVAAASGIRVRHIPITAEDLRPA